jgi:hypothetical protein
MVWLVGCAVVWSVSVTAALAQETKVVQADKAATCAREAKGLKGEEYTRAVNACVTGGSNGNDAGLTGQQRKMKTCNVQAREKELRGDERRAFMSSCLRG